MRFSAKSINFISFIIGVLIAAAFLIAPKSGVEGQEDDRIAITGVTNPSEVIRESRFKIFDLDADGYLTREEIPKEEQNLLSMYTSLDENSDGKLSEPEYVLNGKAE